ncbi:MAG: TlpA family protein disulfide reductase [Planctomycetota bacterium]
MIRHAFRAALVAAVLMLPAPAALFAQAVDGQAPPQFELNDYEGKPHKLSDLKGKVVLIDFWASW